MTEQDVVNEEMYEEEDDDLPMQYRRLTAHLQTGSADFNRRLSAYLTNHVAMRSAFDQAITTSYAQQYPNAPQFSHNQNIFPSPFAMNLAQQQQNHSYGQPNPLPGSPGTPSYRPGQPPRTDSNSHSQNTPLISPPMQTTRSDLSMPQITQRRKSSQSSKTSSRSPVMQRTSMPPTPNSQHYEQKGEEQSTQNGVAVQGSPHQQQQRFSNLNGYPSVSPFSMALPVETQMLLNGALDPNDPMTSALMAGSDNMASPYHYSSHAYSKPRSFSSSFGGMSSTLAPSALDMQSRQQDFSQPTSINSAAPASAPPTQLGFDNPEFSKSQMFSSANSSQGSGTETPVLDAGWDAFINDNSWAENIT